MLISKISINALRGRMGLEWGSGVIQYLEHFGACFCTEFKSASVQTADSRWEVYSVKASRCTPECLMIAHCALLKGQVTCATPNFTTLKSFLIHWQRRKPWQRIWTTSPACRAPARTQGARAGSGKCHLVLAVPTPTDPLETTRKQTNYGCIILFSCRRVRTRRDAPTCRVWCTQPTGIFPSRAQIVLIFLLTCPQS